MPHDSYGEINGGRSDDPIKRDWIVDRKHVLFEIARFERKIDDLQSQLGSQTQKIHSQLSIFHTDLVMLKTKVAVWGAAIGVVAGGLSGVFINVLLRSLGD